MTTIIMPMGQPQSSRPKKNEERDSIDTVVPDSVLSTNLFP